MVEILLIVFSVTISNRFRQAGQTGAKKYVLGIWMTYLGVLILAGMLGGIVDSIGNSEAMIAVIYPTLIIGYVVEIIVACKGLSHSKRLLQEKQAQNYSANYQYRQGRNQPQPYPQQYVPVQHDHGYQQYPPQYVPVQQGTYSAAAYCTNCATPLIDGSRFCIECGTPVTVVPIQTIQQATPAVTTAPAILKKASAWLFLIPITTAIIGGILLSVSITQQVNSRNPTRYFDLIGEMTFQKAGSYFICTEGGRSNATLVFTLINKDTGEEVSSIFIPDDKRVEVRASGTRVTSYASIDIKTPGKYTVYVSGTFNSNSGLGSFVVYQPFTSHGQSVLGIVFGGVILLLTLFIFAFIAERRLSPALPKSRKVALTLAIIPHTGFFGIDRLYLGHFTIALFKFITCGGCLVLYIIDIYRISTWKMKDRRGNQLR